MLAVASHYVAWASVPVIAGLGVLVGWLCQTGRAETELSMSDQLDEIRALPEVDQ